MIKITVKNTQTAKAQLQKALREFVTDKFVTVGIHEDANARPADDSDSNINNATLGALMHFGNQTENIPARPFLDVGVLDESKQYLEIIKNNPNDLDKALNQIGVVAVGSVQQYMTDLKEPGNAEITIKRKGSDNPLIDTGELRQSINYAIVTKKPPEGVE